LIRLPSSGSVFHLLFSRWRCGKWRKNHLRSKFWSKPPLLLILAAIALSWNYMGFMLGVEYTTPSNAQLFIQAGPILLAIAGLIFFKEKITRNQVVGFSIAIIGFSFFYSDQLSAFFEKQSNYNLGVLLTISGAVTWAVYAAAQKKLVTNFSVESLNLFLFGFPTLIYLPFINLAPLFQLNWGWWLLMFFLGANTLISYTCLSFSLKYLEANKVSIIIILNPMITFAAMEILSLMKVDWIELERFSIITIIGAALVLSGAILVVKKSRKKQEKMQ
jgi:drug/metabolite transporter (DMT)-like permease